jgi:endogenous inhibitor of DNA gyrase (YacG/DUF329 family)
MGTVMIKCPTTGKAISTGMGADKASFESSNFSQNGVKCPACGKTHVWDKKDAWVQD